MTLTIGGHTFGGLTTAHVTVLNRNHFNAHLYTDKHAMLM